MREIKFRGKRLDNDNWVYGSYVKGATRHCIVQGLANYPRYDVKQSTIGEFVGLLDKYGKRIYEGDILEDIEYGRYFVKYNKMSLMYELVQDGIGWSLDGFCPQNFNIKSNSVNLLDFEIIGNIYDNPELIGE